MSERSDSGFFSDVTAESKNTSGFLASHRHHHLTVTSIQHQTVIKHPGLHCKSAGCERERPDEYRIRVKRNIEVQIT